MQVWELGFDACRACQVVCQAGATRGRISRLREAVRLVLVVRRVVLLAAVPRILLRAVLVTVPRVVLCAVPPSIRIHARDPGCDLRSGRGVVHRRGRYKRAAGAAVWGVRIASVIARRVSGCGQSAWRW
eukprot:365285-Chlamydomonas_euryale.AAC.13